MVASSSCATDPQAHLPMLYYACYIRRSVVVVVALMPIHTAIPTATRCNVAEKCDIQRTLALKIRRNFQRNQRADSMLDPIGFNGASELVKRIFDVPTRSLAPHLFNRIMLRASRS